MSRLGRPWAQSWWRWGEKAELWRFKGKTVKVKWARVNKGSEVHSEVRFRLVAQELGFRERLDELFAGTPSLTVVKLLLSVTADKDLSVMLLDVKCALLYGGGACGGMCTSSVRVRTLGMKMARRWGN